MVAARLEITARATPVFPEQEVRRRLRAELQNIADEGSVLRPDWEPLLDSKRVVGTVLVLEDLFPFKIPPDKIVRKGGYNSVDEAIDDMVDRVSRIWGEKNQPKVREMSKERTTQNSDNVEDRKALGEKLREAREYLGFSQDQVATFLDVSRIRPIHDRKRSTQSRCFGIKETRWLIQTFCWTFYR
ncbi:MAG: hypothetical protein QM811_13520 [Pirellulales bacterium]